MSRKITQRPSEAAEDGGGVEAHDLLYPGVAPAGQRPSASIFDWAGFGVYGRPA